jgi:hypothetical protein
MRPTIELSFISYPLLAAAVVSVATLLAGLSVSGELADRKTIKERSTRQKTILQHARKSADFTLKEVERSWAPVRGAILAGLCAEKRTNPGSRLIRSAQTQVPALIKSAPTQVPMLIKSAPTQIRQAPAGLRKWVSGVGSEVQQGGVSSAIWNVILKPLVVSAFSIATPPELGKGIEATGNVFAETEKLGPEKHSDQLPIKSPDLINLTLDAAVRQLREGFRYQARPERAMTAWDGTDVDRRTGEVIKARRRREMSWNIRSKLWRTVASGELSRYRKQIDDEIARWLVVPLTDGQPEQALIMNHMILASRLLEVEIVLLTSAVDSRARRLQRISWSSGAVDAISPKARRRSQAFSNGAVIFYEIDELLRRVCREDYASDRGEELLSHYAEYEKEFRDIRARYGLTWAE